MTLDKNAFEARVLAALSDAHSPYDGMIGGVYLDNAWKKGAEHMALTCIALFDDKNRSPDR